MRIHRSTLKGDLVVLIASGRVALLRECCDAVEALELVGIGVDGAAAADVVARTIAIDLVVVDGELLAAEAHDVLARVRPRAPHAPFVLVGRASEPASGFQSVAEPLDEGVVTRLVRAHFGIDAPGARPKPLARVAPPPPPWRQRARA